MSDIQHSKKDGIGIVRIERGKVNALNESLVDELAEVVKAMEHDDEVKVMILTGSNKFFSFGFDIPEFLNYDRGAFTAFLIKFTNLYTNLFMFPKPVIAAINGHAIAGGCMLATACDYRLMVAGKARIGINELGFGSTVFAGSVEMLKFAVGQRNAGNILYSHQLYSGSEAMSLGLVDRMSTSLDMPKELSDVARTFFAKNADAFRSVKHLLRSPVRDAMLKRESHSIHEFVDIWYSKETWANLKEIKIHG